MSDLRDKYPVVVSISVAWGEIDSFQHLNNVVYFRYFETARIEYFQRVALWKPGATLAQGPILASASMRFKAPVTFPDTVFAAVRVTDIEKDRFKLDFALASKRLGRVAATGEGTIVSYDYVEGKKIDLPAAWIDAIRAIEATVGA
ncbi:acyl-CoA thioesterase [bacterium]|nr:acyl-CoA thioesterase [bacterium]